MSDKLIKNCKFKTKCDQSWNEMSLTDDEDVRFCKQCQKQVHLCLSDYELETAIDNNWCVAIFNANDEDSLMRVGEVVSTYSPSTKTLDWDD